MSSQESAAAPSSTLPLAAAASDPSTGGASRRRGRHAATRKRRRRPPPAPLGRLGWLGGGMMKTSASAATTNRCNDGIGEADGVGDGISGRLTPRADYYVASAPAPAAPAPAIDLTGNDGDEDDIFAFKDSPMMHKRKGDRAVKSNYPAAASQKIKSNNSNDNSGERTHLASNNQTKTGAKNDAGTTSNENGGDWACRRCTYLNSCNSKVCEMCDSRRESCRSGGNGSKKLMGKRKKERSKKHGSNYANVGALTENLDCTNADEHSKNLEKLDNTARSLKANRADKKLIKPNNKLDDKRSLRKWMASSQLSRSLSEQSTLSQQLTLSQQSSQWQQSSMMKSKTAQSLMVDKRQSLAKVGRSNNRDGKETEMWVDKHAPRTSNELCVAPKKVEEVRRFLSSHVSYFQSRLRSGKHGALEVTLPLDPWVAPDDVENAPPQTKLMILVGAPGVGKSTLVRTLAREIGVEVLTWNDAHVEYNAMQRQQPFELASYLPYQSQLGSFEEFLKGGGSGTNGLYLVEDSPDIAALGDEWDKTKGGGIDRTSADYVSSLILIEEIPNLYNAEAARSFR